MEEEGQSESRRARKRSRSNSSDDSTTTEREKKTKGTYKRLTLNDDPAVYARRIPYFGENSINNILKVVSLQSFSNPRLSLLNDGDRESERDEVADHKASRTGESDSLSDSSEELTRRDRPSSSSEERVPSSGHPHIVFPSKSRSKRGDFKNGNVLNEAITGKDQRYWEKRQRNNASAKRSRDARRVRELETQIRAEYLEDENYRLKVENEVLREENARLTKTIERLKENANNSDKDCSE